MGNELGELALEAERRRRGGVDRGNLVEQIGEPHEVGVIRHVGAPNGVVHQLVANGHLLGEGLLAIVHECGAPVEVFVEGVVEVKAQQGLALSAECGLVFERHADAGAGVDDALVGDGDRTHAVVHGVVAVFGKGDAAGGDHHRAARHIHGVEPDHVARRGLILALEHKLVFILILPRHGERGVVQFLIHIVGGHGVVANHFLQV